MNNNLRKIFLLLFVFISATLFADKIAVATKVKGMAEIMKVGKKEFNNLKAGSILDDGDKIRTGKSGFVAIIFIDDKSTLKIKENSEAVITGRRTAKDISKKLKVNVINIKIITFRILQNFEEEIDEN